MISGSYLHPFDTALFKQSGTINFETPPKYIKAFSKYDFLTVPPVSDNHAWHLFILQINNKVLSINRDEFIQALGEQGIGTSVHYIPLHLMSYYKKLYGFQPEDFPVAFKKYKKAISIPIYPDLTDEQIDRIIKSVIDTGRNNYKGPVYGR